MGTKYIASYTRSHMLIHRYSLHTTTSIHYYVTVRHDIKFEYVLNHITQKITQRFYKYIGSYIHNSIPTHYTKVSLSNTTDPLLLEYNTLDCSHAFLADSIFTYSSTGGAF